MVFQVEAMTSGPCIVQYPPCSSIHDKDSKSLPRCGEVCFSLSCNSNPDFDLLESIRGTADSLKSDNALLEAVRFITHYNMKKLTGHITCLDSTGGADVSSLPLRSDHEWFLPLGDMNLFSKRHCKQRIIQ